MAVDLTHTIATTRVGRLRTGAMAHPGVPTRTHIMAVIRTGYNNYYSYYTPTYGYNASMVASVQRRLGQLGYYHGAVDGIIGPQNAAPSRLSKAGMGSS